ncbi:hypothetical protein [Breznakiella homolactica]|uniref:Uncharacterized protein n=1 Tax=Breznakiella homolactica TaxID=2798577 RepID=A0A7T7XQS4_9SPIR|nr:hypothetical protein [Breznakiella homolactica]QQO10717.1 hypothetical protein JFL75_07330 [Breznakiella homolactica]
MNKILLVLCLFSVQNLFSSTIRMDYWGPIDKPLPIIAFTKEIELRYEYKFSMNRLSKFEMHFTITNDIYSFIIEKIKLCSSEENVGKEMYIICEVFEAENEALFFLIKPKELILILNEVMPFIENNNIISQINNYILNLSAIVLEYSKKE